MNYKEYTVRVLNCGERHWFQNGKLHREDGPAIEYVNGTKCWYLNGKLHREDGPAIEWPDGGKLWYQNGNLHREDGPAIEYADGRKYWYFEGVKYSEKEFQKKMSPQQSCDGKIVEIDGKKYKLAEV